MKLMGEKGLSDRVSDQGCRKAGRLLIILLYLASEATCCRRGLDALRRGVSIVWCLSCEGRLRVSSREVGRVLEN
jgi:hypothetical protein